MKVYEKPKGTWVGRTSIQLLTIVLGVLIFWVLGFLIQDIKTIKGPVYKTFEKMYSDKTLDDKNRQLESDIRSLEREIRTFQDIQNRTEKSTRNLQETINQLIEIQKLDLQKGTDKLNQEKTDFYATLNVFLENQTRYQELNTKISNAISEKENLEEQKERVSRQISVRMAPARMKHKEAMRMHNLKLAFFQLLLLIPVLAVSAVLMIKKREGLYFPFFMATGGAALVKVGLVAHEYFPSEYFKYTLIGALILVVGKILHHFIKNTSTPKLKTLMKQYKDAYKRFLCPVCEYPICMGPRRFLYWTRRTVNKVMAPVTINEKYTPYTCPSCSTRLFEKCDSCGEIRHSLLPSCESCGSEKPICSKTLTSG